MITWCCHYLHAYCCFALLLFTVYQCHTICNCHKGKGETYGRTRSKMKGLTAWFSSYSSMLLVTIYCKLFERKRKRKMSRAVFYCGSAGVGKSTLINKITERELARVSHLAHKDGTEGVQRFPDPSDGSLAHIDLPGLDSRNFPTQVTEHIQTLYPSYKLLAVLVINSQAGRLTTFVDAFNGIMSDLVGSNAPFAIVYTRGGIITAENEQYMKQTYPNATMFNDDDVAGIRSYIANPLLFKTQIKTAAREAAAQRAPLVPSLRSPQPPAVRSAVPKAPKVPKPTFMLGIPSHLQEVSGFSVVRQTAALDILIKEVLEIKKYNGTSALKHVRPEIAKGVTSDTFKHYRFLGDRTLWMLASRIIYAGGERDKLKIFTDMITGNGPECAMQHFYDKYVRTIHNEQFRSEAGVIADDREVDVVEALLELSMGFGKKANVFKFIMVELFTSVGLGRFVGK